MDINAMVGAMRATVVSPSDTAVITVERYLTGQQLGVIHQHFQKKLPDVKILVLHGGMTCEVIKASGASVSA